MRKNGNYVLTSLGKVVYESNMLIGHVLENYWKLKEINSIEMSIPDQDMSSEKRKSIVDSLKNSKIKDILLNPNKEDKIGNKQIINTLGASFASSHISLHYL